LIYELFRRASRMKREKERTEKSRI